MMNSARFGGLFVAALLPIRFPTAVPASNFYLTSLCPLAVLQHLPSSCQAEGMSRRLSTARGSARQRPPGRFFFGSVIETYARRPHAREPLPKQQLCAATHRTP